MMTTIGTPSSQSATLFMTRTPYPAARSRHAVLSGTNKVVREFLYRDLSGIPLMHEIIYLVGLVVVVMFILSALGLH